MPRGSGRVPGHAEAPGANRAEGPAGRIRQCGRQHDEVNVQGLRSAHCVDQNGGREIHALRCGAGAAAGKIITGNGTVLSADIGGLAAFEPDGVGHVSHFATCPAAEQFRRKGAGRRGEDGQENGVPDLQEESSVCRRP